MKKCILTNNNSMEFSIDNKLSEDVEVMVLKDDPEFKTKEIEAYIQSVLRTAKPEQIFGIVKSLRGRMSNCGTIIISDSFICNFINQHKDALPSSDLWREIETKYENDVILWRTYRMTDEERKKCLIIDNALFILLCIEGQDEVEKKLSILMKERALGFRNARDLWFQLKRCNIERETNPPRVEDLSVSVEFLFDLTRYLVEIVEERSPMQKFSAWESDTIRDQIDYFIQQFTEIYRASPRSARHDEIQQFIVTHPLSIYNQAQAERERMWSEELPQEHLRDFIEAHLAEFSYNEMIRRIVNMNVEDHIGIAVSVAWRLRGVRELLEHLQGGVEVGNLGYPELYVLMNTTPDDQELKQGINQILNRLKPSSF